MSEAPLSYVYFIQSVTGTGPIKIGCSFTPTGRLSSISAWSPTPLKILATAPGDKTVERQVHGRFAFAHSHLEWFHPVTELVSAIDEIASGVPLHEAIDLSIVTGNIRAKKQKPEPEYRVGYRSYSMRIVWTRKKRRQNGLKTAWGTPQDVEEIMRRWAGNPYQNVIGVRPTHAEFARLDEYLSDPATHSVRKNLAPIRIAA